MPNFTPDQIRAIEQEGNIIVSAGAGSGKTAVLSERVLYFIKNKGYKISDFLILTFTRLAAGEMKERIRKKLKENALEDASFVDVSDITTFDSFSNGIVKKYHTFLGIDSSFTTVDKNVIDILNRKLIREELDKLYLNEDPLFAEMISKYCFKNDEVIISLILNVLQVGDLQIDKDKFYNEFIERTYSLKTIKEIYNTIYRMLSLKLNDLLNDNSAVPDIEANKNGDSYLALFEQALSELKTSYDYPSLREALINLKFPRAPKGYKEMLEENEIKAFESYKKAFSSLKQQVEFFSTFEEGKNRILDFKKYAELIINISKKVDKEQFAYKLKHQAFEFSDICNFAIRLVKENESIREELRNKYKMIMIDEYQDTSEIQEIFISLIQNNNVYCVGDIKQSIYAFRNARCDIFKDKYDLYKKGIVGTAIDLKKNFRSRSEVLNNINSIFEEIMTDSYGGANYKKDHIIDYGNLSYLDEINENQDNNLFIYEYSNSDKEHEIRIIAEDIIEKINSKYQVIEMTKNKSYLRPCEFKDFAILLDRGTSFDTYIRIFNEYQIPLYVEQDENLSENTTVMLFVNILKMTKMIKNDLPLDQSFIHAFVSLARSFIFNYTDEELYLICKNKTFKETEVYQRLLKVISNNIDLAPFELLIKIIDELEIYHKFTRIGNVEKNSLYLDYFISIFKQMSEIDYLLDDFIEYLNNIDEFGLNLTLSSKGTSINSVRLMNIHKSKGLEFNIVYFAGLDRTFNRQENKNYSGISNKYGIYLETKEDRYLVKNAYLFDKDNNDISEKIRLLYVSLTRAREKMIFILPQKKDYKEVSLHSSKSFYDFIYPLINKFKIINKDKLLNIKLNVIAKEVEYEKYLIKDIYFDNTFEEKISKASKEVSFEVNKETLKLGNDLHFMLEVIDFKNPNYGIIKHNYIKNRIEKFLNSDLLEDISKAKIYKEYEFIDELNNSRGIIDLLVVYDDYIKIIDYKTKNIDDENYDKQLNVYYDFIVQKYGLPIDMYLYSLMEGTYRKVERK